MLINASIKVLQQLLLTRKISSVELARVFLNRIQRLNVQLNAFITIDEDKTLQQARCVDNLSAKSARTFFTGIPIAHKDIFVAKDWRTTCGSRMLSNFIGPYDAHVIDCFNKAGAVNLGKTNMDEFAMGSSNETSFFGAVKNPWHLDYVPGGSSGGSAAAVAGRLCPVATGTDTGGSIRQPASLCNITGLKPSYGLVSRFGMIAFASTLDQAGPMAKTAEDCAFMMNVMRDFDARDSTCLEKEKEDYTRYLEQARQNKPLQGLKIGLPKEYFSQDLDAKIATVIQQALQVYQELGAELKEIELPNTRFSIPVYYVLAPAEASSNLSRFDGVRYGYRTKDYENINEMFIKTRSEGFGEEVKRRILIGTYVLSAGYYDAYYLKAQKVRRLITEDFKKAFQECDVIIGPTTPSTAFRLNEKIADPTTMYLQDIYTIAVNLAGLPGMSIPAGFSEGLPVGLQIIGNYFDEARMLFIAYCYQQITDWHERMPDGISSGE